MKKASVITLIVSAGIVLIGIIMCICASSMAQKNNTLLFKQEGKDNGDLVEIIDFENKTINKIDISLKNTKINLIGGCEKSYVEIINFSSFDYNVSINQQVLTVNNKLFSTLLSNFPNANFEFNGFRDFFNLTPHNKEKTVNIYLSENKNIKIFDVSLKSGNITVENLSSRSDLNIFSDSSDIIIKNSNNISTFNSNLKSGNVRIENTYFEKIKLSSGNGKFEYELPENAEYNYYLVAEMGKVFFSGEDAKPKIDKKCENAIGDIDVRLGMGDIYIFKKGE